MTTTKPAPDTHSTYVLALAGIVAARRQILATAAECATAYSTVQADLDAQLTELDDAADVLLDQILLDGITEGAT